MIAASYARIETGAIARLDSQPPLTLRQVRAPHGVVGLCLVGTAAGPLDGDDLRLGLDIAAGARTELCASGASIAQGGRSRVSIDIRLGPYASLTADPGALVITESACVDLTVRIEMHPTASIRWRELVVLGRTGQAPGAARLRWDVVADELPLLRQEIDLRDRAMAAWRGILAGRRVLLSEFIAGPEVSARTVVHSRTAVTHRLTDHASLTSALANSAAELPRSLQPCCG